MAFFRIYWCFCLSYQRSPFTYFVLDLRIAKPVVASLSPIKLEKFLLWWDPAESILCGEVPLRVRGWHRHGSDLKHSRMVYPGKAENWLSRSPPSCMIDHMLLRAGLAELISTSDLPSSRSDTWTPRIGGPETHSIYPLSDSKYKNSTAPPPSWDARLVQWFGRLCPAKPLLLYQLWRFSEQRYGDPSPCK